jgi:hypothetical protein
MITPIGNLSQPHRRTTMITDGDRKAYAALLREMGVKDWMVADAAAGIDDDDAGMAIVATHREAAFKAGQEAERARIIASWCEAFTEVPYDNGCHAHTDQGEGL